MEYGRPRGCHQARCLPPLANSRRCRRYSSSTPVKVAQVVDVPRAGTRWPVSRRLTLDVLIIRRSATCSAVKSFSILCTLSNAPSSRRPDRWAAAAMHSRHVPFSSCPMQHIGPTRDRHPFKAGNCHSNRQLPFQSAMLPIEEKTGSVLEKKPQITPKVEHDRWQVPRRAAGTWKRRRGSPCSTGRPKSQDLPDRIERTQDVPGPDGHACGTSHDIRARSMFAPSTVPIAPKPSPSKEGQR